MDTMMFPGDSEKFDSLFGQATVYTGPALYQSNPMTLYGADDSWWGNNDEDTDNEDTGGDDEEDTGEDTGGVQSYKGRPVDDYFTNIEPVKWNSYSTTYTHDISGYFGEYEGGVFAGDFFDYEHISQLNMDDIEKYTEYEDTGHIDFINKIKIPWDNPEKHTSNYAHGHIKLKIPTPGEPHAEEFRYHMVKVYDYNTKENIDAKVYVYVPYLGKSYRPDKEYVDSTNFPNDFLEKITGGKYGTKQANLDEALGKIFNTWLPLPMGEEVLVRISAKGYKPRYFIITTEELMIIDVPMVPLDYKGEMPAAKMNGEEHLFKDANKEMNDYYTKKEEGYQNRADKKICPVCGYDWNPDGWHTKYNKSAKKAYEDMTEQGWYKAAGGKPIKEFKGKGATAGGALAGAGIGFAIGGPAGAAIGGAMGAVAGAAAKKGGKKGYKDALKKFYKKNSIATCKEFGHLIPMTKEQEEAARQYRKDKKTAEDKEKIMNILKWAGIGFGALLLIGGGIFAIFKFKKKKKKQTVAPAITQAGQVQPQTQKNANTGTTINIGNPKSENSGT